MDEDKERLIRLEENIKQLVLLMDRNRNDLKEDIASLKKGQAELHERIDDMVDSVAENKVARNIGKAVLWLVTTTGIAYIIQHIRLP